MGNVGTVGNVLGGVVLTNLRNAISLEAGTIVNQVWPSPVKNALAKAGGRVAAAQAKLEESYQSVGFRRDNATNVQQQQNFQCSTAWKRPLMAHGLTTIMSEISH